MGLLVLVVGGVLGRLLWSRRVLRKVEMDWLILEEAIGYCDCYCYGAIISFSGFITRLLYM